MSYLRDDKELMKELIQVREDIQGALTDPSFFDGELSEGEIAREVERMERREAELIALLGLPA